MANTDMELGEVDAIGETVRFLLAYEEKGHDRVYQPSIFRVPTVHRDISPSSYNPQVVSIGPFHREAKNVQAMEVRKPTYLYNLLACLELPHEQTLKTCVEKVIGSIDKIKNSYDEMKSYTDVELAKMMVMDGLFILEFFYKFDDHFSDLMLVQSTLYDLLLLENQIPFFVLQDLFECTILKCQPHVSLITLIISAVKDFNFFLVELRKDNVLQGTSPDHILGLLHKCYQPEKSIQPKYTNSTLHSAVELDRSGVKFKPSRDPSWPMAIEVESSRIGCFSWFCDRPTLIMPVMQISVITESTIRNLIVYEQSSPSVRSYITSYAVAIDNLVDTEDDIAMLVESGVLTHYLGSDEEVANLINSISKDIPKAEYYYVEQWDKLDRYYSSYWPKNIAWLRRTYFNSPWNMIALLAGIVLFALTVVQTIFTIRPV